MRSSGQDPSFALGDARLAAAAAEEAGALDGRAAAVAAIATRLLNENERVGWHAGRALPPLVVVALLLLGGEPTIPVGNAYAWSL